MLLPVKIVGFFKLSKMARFAIADDDPSNLVIFFFC